MRKRRCFRLLILVLPVENLMLSIANLMVDARCVATTGGSKLFCIYIILHYIPKIYDRATTALAHCFLLGGVAFGEARFLVLSWWC
jgi:hypothetical protein